LSAWEENKPPQLLFPNATYLVSQSAWERACNPHARDKASFIPHLIPLLQASNRLHIIDQETSPLLGTDYRFLFTNGHTPGLMHTLIHMPEEGDSVLFVSDLIPGSFWVHLPIGMGYDRFPELLVDEKKAMLESAVKNNLRLFYTHDPLIAVSHITQDAAGKFKPIHAVQTIP
jgi:glyoxylase-like metal-dependent hydrolase (beta-lactamase superfamily II)